MNNKVKTQIIVKDQTVGVMIVDGKEYISLTDLARYADSEEPRLPIRDWMRSKDVISFLGLWEEINNVNFKRANSPPLKMKLVVILLRCHLRNGFEKQMLLE